ncbi:type II secretion system GspH family protein [Patescibacteria group bacterium]|nr:type II secretion system GspH family protein [Patescibacteria group bacterium]MBU2544724.1 type II secretion system GspH family protein [Patescibacteria group bacterium]
MKKAGFTLIELLIVIALLGALAVGLIGALDPFEQLKKGTDTSTRDLVNQVQTGVIRYYSIKNNMPWCPTGTGCVADPSGTDLSTAPMVASVSEMVNAGELKSDFTTIQAAKLGKIFVTGSQTNNFVSVCYKPTSKSFAADPNTKYTKLGALDATNCPGGVACYWCIQ